MTRLVIMKNVSVSDLNARLSHYLREVGRGMNVPRTFAALASFIFAAACMASDGGSTTTQPNWRTVRVARGDTTVVRTVGVGRDSSRLRLVEEVSIGKRDGTADETFTFIARVRPTPDGGIILTDGIRPAATQVKMFSGAGSFMRNIGRIGRGPGEYSSPSAIAVAPRGELLVWASMRVNVYAPNGDFKTSWAAPSTSGQFVDASGRVYSDATMNDPELPDSLVAPSGMHVQRNIAIRTSLDGVVIDTIVSPRARISRRLFACAVNSACPDRIVAPQPNQFVAYSLIAIPYVPLFVSAISPLGYYVSGDAAHFAIMLETHDGKPLRIESDRAALTIDALERRERYEHIRAKAQEIAPSDIARTKPFFRHLRVDEDGRIWVWLSQPSVRIPVADTVRAAAAGTSKYTWSEVSVYDVFAPTGEFLGSVRLPERATFAAAKDNKLWLTLTDDLDVPRVVRYRIEGLRQDR